jgi:K+-sensing histidine kinase KdpD
MPLDTTNRKLLTITIVYWVLLLYIVAALIWWFVALTQQNHALTITRLLELKQDDPSYAIQVNKILALEQRKTAQYIGEGVTFFILIVIGAVFVYRATRKQIHLSNQQQNFMMAITHELKTPIAITKLNLETLQKRRLEEAQQQKLIQNTLHEANRLNLLCNNILFASQLDAGAYTFTKNTVNLSDIVTGCVADFKQRFPNKTMHVDIANNVEVYGEELLLQMMVNNLLENALKYAPKETAVAVALTKQTKQVELTVKDNGPGISDEEKDKVFDKFYRVGNEKVRKTKGTGLGLYLCKKIASDHNANIVVTNNQPQGCIFAVTFKQ